MGQLRAGRPSASPPLRGCRLGTPPPTRPTTPLVPSGDDGWWIIHTDLENPHEACAAVLSQAGNAQVLAPPELADLVRDAAWTIFEATTR